MEYDKVTEHKKQNRQGRKRADGTTATPRPLCPKCGEIMARAYTRGNAERKRAYVGMGWACPADTCDYIIKDFVEIIDTEEVKEE